MNLPKNLIYSKDYLWIEAKRDVATIGIIDYAAKTAKEFAYVNLPKKGDKIKKGQNLISLEAVKWAGTLKSPISGEVIEANSEAYNEPFKINANPYLLWLVKLKIEKKDELKLLMNSADALNFYKKESGELKK